MTLKNQILSKYDKVDDRVNSFLDKVISDLNAKKIAITDYTVLILNMLVAQLVLYFKAVDDVMNTENVTNSDAYNRKSKTPEIAVLQKSNDQILNLLDKISLSPLSAAKIKKLNKSDDQDSSELLDKLINE